jgi:hypothetical protein
MGNKNLLQMVNDKFQKLETNFFCGLKIAVENQKWAENEEFFKEHDEFLARHYKKSLGGILRSVNFKNLNLSIPACDGSRMLHQTEIFDWFINECASAHAKGFLKNHILFQKPTPPILVEVKKMTRHTRDFQLIDALLGVEKSRKGDKFCFTDHQIITFCEQENFPKKKHFLFLVNDKERERNKYRFTTVYKESDKLFSYYFDLGYSEEKERHDFAGYYIVIPL